MPSISVVCQMAIMAKKWKKRSLDIEGASEEQQVRTPNSVAQYVRTSEMYLNFAVLGTNMVNILSPNKNYRCFWTFIMA